MAEVSDWEKHKIQKIAYMIIVLFLLLGFLFQYGLFDYLGDNVGDIFLIFAFGAVLGAILKILKKRIGDFIFFFSALMIIIIGSIAKDMYFIVVISLIPFLLLFLSLEILASKRKSTLRITVPKKTSITFHDILVNEIEKKLKQNKFLYSKDGNILNIGVTKKEKTKVVVDMENHPKTGNQYMVVIWAKSKNPVVENIKTIIRDRVLELENEYNIDNFPDNEELVCNYCDTYVYYYPRNNLCFCRKCKKYRKRDEIHLIQTKK